MSARYAPEKGELDVPEPDSPTEANVADSPTEADIADPAAGPPDSPPPDELRSRGEVYAESRQRADGDWTQDQFEAPRAELAQFNPERAALPAMSPDAADEYIERNRATRPWLAITDTATPEARRIIAAMDAADGHAQIRHEGWVTEEANMRRAAYLEDPAQLDPTKRYLGVDGLRQNDQRHLCRSTATRIADPDAFAAAFARGVEHPKVREALDMAFDPDDRPGVVTIPISDLLGPQGHRHCTGWRLEPVDGNMRAARNNRDSWLAARTEERTGGAPEPQAVPVPTFEGGHIVFAFSRNDGEQRYEVTTMFPRPSQT